jgi:hypothetical protein
MSVSAFTVQNTPNAGNSGGIKQRTHEYQSDAEVKHEYRIGEIKVRRAYSFDERHGTPLGAGNLSQ